MTPTKPPAAKAPKKYGGRGRPWHADFIKYVKFIAEHSAYTGMPDAYSEPGRVQWEAPSNRPPGKFKDTHGKRLKWWAQQANGLGISTSSEHWISRTAKRLHPTKKKPCKICGRVLQLRYVYPQQRFLDKIRRLAFVEKTFELEPLEPIESIVSRLVKTYGDAALAALPQLFATPRIQLPSPLPSDLNGWLKWIDEVFVASEPRGLLSPGAMSNAPDRFDGFHSDNLCCRGTADTGRHKTNLQGYVTDRRVFEYWSSGDWVAADRLMGVLRTKFPKELCRNGHPGPCDADHIGPISLGFAHRPKFQLLCGACNSAKNNRMYLSDVKLLLADEDDGDTVISWHSAALWDACKTRVQTDEHARRLSKVLRDNRHSLMHALRSIADAGGYTFLASLLELDRADYKVEFENARVEDHLTVFDTMNKKPRTTSYAGEQKARRCRVAFEALQTYFDKTNRNAYVVQDEDSERFLREATDLVKKAASLTQESDSALKTAIAAPNATSAAAFRALLDKLKSKETDKIFAQARSLLAKHMDAIGGILASRWDDERYVRELESKDDEELLEAEEDDLKKK